MSYRSPILQTRLFRPKLPPDHVYRERLQALLQQGYDLPLTLISASAGYGKSTLISSWLQHIDVDSAWISLDRNQCDLPLFVHYVVAALEGCGHSVFEATRSLLHASEPTPAEYLRRILINDLSNVSTEIILVLDDYHVITSVEIHDLINELVLNPLDRLHLVIIARHDPPLPMNKYRARRLLNEIRSNHLSFTRSETANFLHWEQTAETADKINTIHQQTEGWITALRLVQFSGSIEETVVSHDYSLEYLSSEVLAQQHEAIQEFLLVCSVLEQFCAPLCDHVLQHKSDNRSAESIIRELLGKGMFVIALDENRDWYRFHHLFRDALSVHFKRTFLPDQINQIHKLAAHWLQGKGMILQAFRHFIAAEDETSAIEIFRANRSTLMNSGEWGTIQEMCSYLNSDYAKTDPDVILGQFWLMFVQGKRTQLFQQLNPGTREKLLVGKAANLSSYIGEFNALLSYKHYTGDAVDHEAALAEANTALASLQIEEAYPRGFAWIFYGGCMLALRRGSEAIHHLHRQLDQARLKSERLYILMIINYIHWLSADLKALKHSTAQYRSEASVLARLNQVGVANLFEGHSLYLMNDISNAVEALRKAYPVRFQMLTTHRLATICSVALALYESGNIDDASDVAADFGEYAMMQKHNPSIFVFEALQAELNWRSGNVDEAFHWARHADSSNYLVTITDFYYQYFTLIKLLIYEGSSGAYLKAADILHSAHAYFTKFNYTSHLIQAHALSAMLAHAKNQEQKAYDQLLMAIDLSRESKPVRIFLDMGSKMRDLMQKLHARRSGDAFLEQLILETRAVRIKRGMSSTSGRPPGASILTTREREILELLALRLTNKEIALELSISYETVKRHTKNLYQKLEVGSRMEAVSKARELSILPDRVNLS